MASYQYIYVMKDLSKTYPGGKKVLEHMTLSFLPGAKIGVLGPNGAGKSTLLKIMAGLDNEFTGEAWAAEGVKVGIEELHEAEAPAVLLRHGLRRGALLDNSTENRGDGKEDQGGDREFEGAEKIPNRIDGVLLLVVQIRVSWVR